MSGKPYTIQELKIIVDYLVDNKLYGETRARKMWVDFANTKLTSRTWQSLKETFLKRILPDIHNPYFQLNNEQISSFRARCDLADRNKNKLDIQTISDDSNSNDHDPKENEPGKEGETIAGENTKCSKVPVRSRSSADTVILDNCYDTAEDIQKDLESNESDEKPCPAIKSFRDCITYSEPLTPMLQEVLDDFASEPEDSDKEGRMEIVENVPEENSKDLQENSKSSNETTHHKSVATDVAKNAKGLSAEIVEEVLAQELDGSNKSENNSTKKDTPHSVKDPEELPILNLDEEISSIQAENGTEREDDTHSKTLGTNLVTAEVPKELVVQNSETPDVIMITDSHSEPQQQSGGLNNSNSTVDASLPNNPEALKNKKSKDGETKTESKEVTGSEIEVSNISDKTQSLKKATRKRSCSEDNSNTIDNKKKKLDIKLNSPGKTDKKVTESPLDADDKLKVNETNVKSDVIKKPLLEDNPVDINKPSTSFETCVADKKETEKRSNPRDTPEIKNPCLQNISLFDEQFNKAKYNMSESSDTEQNKKETQTNKQEASGSKPANEVVVLRSNSESDKREVHTSPKKKQRAGVLTSKSERDKAIANMFGFTSGGGVGAKRKRQLSRRRRTISHNNASHQTAAGPTNSSDWTSESASDEFVSPPRSRRNRPTRKYLKPRAARISSLAEEGGLFVMYGKKIFPLVKDGKIVKNYVTYLPESDSEEEGEAFWKSKYVEEKKKAAELKKLLEAKEPPQIRDSNTPVQQSIPLRNSNNETQAVEPSNGVGKEICVAVPEEKREEPKVNPPEKIKIKFTRNNEEVHLEGHWPQIHPVLEQVVHIFHKEAETSVKERSKMAVTHSEPKELSSGSSTPIVITPVDPEVHEKVNEIEKEIFKEIEERDKAEENEPIVQANNVTKRRIGKARKSSTSIQSPEKQPKPSNGIETKEPEENGRTRRQKAKETENNNNTQENIPKQQTRTPRKVLNETVNINESKSIQTRRSAQKLNSSVTNEDEEVRYMLPPKSTRGSLKSPANKTKQKKSTGQAPKIVSSPDTVSLKSMDSTQGYQDSDSSPVNTETRKKKKMDMSSFTIKTRNSLRRSTRRRPHPYVYHDAYNDSSNSSVDVSVKLVNRENSSVNTEAYRSESYQLLNPQAKVSSRLEPIDETNAIANETYFVRHLESICRDEISAQINKIHTSPSCQMTSAVGSSSNVSLPLSPELSLVENLSISKEMINTADLPTLYEMQSYEIQEATMRSNYMISNADVSEPMINQEWEFRNCNTVSEMSTEPRSLVTESLLKKIGICAINEQVSETATETLNEKLHDLLLESAKKPPESQCAQKQVSMMDVDVSSVAVQKKPKANKNRCSTPQKRKGPKKSVAPTIDPLVEEEHVESCSHSGCKSCPPLIETNQGTDNVTEEIIIADLTKATKKLKVRKKKDIIRVKIQRPKHKKGSKKLQAETAQEKSKISVLTDSGINDSESELFVPANVSVDLIHNHSETCLQASECVGDSIEFVENSQSVITLGDSMQSGDNAWNSRCEGIEEDSISPDLFCNNAQDVTAYNRAYSEKAADTNGSVYYSPLGTEASHTSLITEDLSNDTPPVEKPSKWYLLNEDECNTNQVGAESTMLSGRNYGGSNLKHIFPIACAVPDLSTITEMSKENDSSRKPTLEDLNGLTGDDFNSMSIFDSNF